MKNRIVSGTIIILLFTIFYLLGGNYFVAFISFLSILAYKEIIFLKKYPNSIIILGLIFMLSLVILNSISFGYLMGIKYISLLIPIILLIIPSLFEKNFDKYPLSSAFNLIGLITFIGLGFSSLNILMLTNKMHLLYIVLITALNDTFAYLGGRLYGKRKLSSISPKKTIEGTIIGNIFGIVGGIIFYLVFIPNNLNILLIILITLVLNVMGQVGDLVFSKIKREANIKDFSKLIPGHGGILDRLDSVLVTSLVYIIIITLL